MNFKLILLGALLLSGLFVMVLQYFMVDEKDIQQEEIYQGPVPEGYDLSLFRTTGITKPLGDLNG